MNDQLISKIRSFNRFYTNILGLLSQHILDSEFTLTEVRVLLEIDRITDCTANILMNLLNIDRGYMSRILKGFERKGLIHKESSSTDGRVIFLSLTSSGHDLLSELEEKSNQQLRKLLSHTTKPEIEKLVDSMGDIEKIIQKGLQPLTIRTYQSNDIEYIIQRHRELYENEYGFSAEFGDYVEKYVKKFDLEHQPEQENIWIAECDGKPVGVIAVVKVDNETAQLRWFLIEPGMRGRGLGHLLMQTTLNFCKEKNYRKIILWTVNTLEAARHLYRNYGFMLMETKENLDWTKTKILEELWECEL